MTPRTTIATALATGLAVIGAGTVAVAAPGQQQTRAGQAGPAGLATQAQQQQFLADAAQAGITVEQTDITDLEQMLAATDAEDVQLVLTSLLDGSRHHLAAFERLADRT